MTTTAIEAEVRALTHLDLHGLREVWAKRYGAPPALRSVELLRLMLTWRLQAQALGGLDAKTRRQIERSGRVAPEGLDLGIGTRIRRDWQGGVAEVEVVEGGFRWNGAVYASLSAAATAIAGVRWNGPRFFGLRKAAA
jgi:hypothetical protein